MIVKNAGYLLMMAKTKGYFFLIIMKVNYDSETKGYFLIIMKVDNDPEN